MKNKIMALTLAFALAVSGIAPATEVKAESVQGRTIENGSKETALEMQLGQEYRAELEEGKSAWYKFTPEEDWIYILSSSGNAHTCGRLYSVESEEIKQIAYNDDGGEDYNFSIKYYLEAGKTYYLRASERDWESAVFSVNVKKAEGFELFYNGNVSVTYGESATLKVLAVAPEGEQITYQWYKGKGEEREKIEGAESASYTLPENNVEKYYYCIVAYGEEEEPRTVRFTLDIQSGLTVGSNVGTADEDEGDTYRNVQAEYGKDTELSVTANGGAGELSYQWFKSYGSIEEATGSSYVVKGTEAGTYRCVVTDGLVSKEITFYLSRNTGFTASTESGEMYYHGKNQEKRLLKIKSGEPVTFVITATSQAPITYKWFENGRLIQGASESSYTLQEAESGSYRCTVADGINTLTFYFDVLADIDYRWEGDTSSGTNTLIISGTGTIPTNIKDYINRKLWDMVDNDIKLKVIIEDGVTGIAPQTFCFDEEDEVGYLFRDITIPASVETIGKYAVGYHYYYDDEEGNNYFVNRRCTIHCTKDSAAYTYAVENGITYEIETGLTVGSDIGQAINGDNTRRRVEVEYGKAKELSVTASGGLASPSYQWYYMDESEEDFEAIEGATESSHRIDGTQVGTFCCEVTDGEAVKRITFIIDMKTGFTASTESGEGYDGFSGPSTSSTNRVVKVKSGESVTLAITAESQVQISYNWSKYDETEHDYLPIDCNTNSYTLPKAEDGMYKCAVTDGFDTLTFYFDILTDIDYRWVEDASSGINTLIISGTGTIPKRITNYIYMKLRDMFLGNIKLKVIIEDGVTGIESKTFSFDYEDEVRHFLFCDITIPASVENMGSYAVGYYYDEEGGYVVYRQCVIHCAKDSAAYTYAVDHGINYEIMEPVVVVDINTCNITLQPESAAYTGSEIKPQVTVKDGNKTLTEGTDYTVTYENNINVGNAAKVTVTGKGNYTGTVPKTFTITAKTIANATVALTPSSYYYNGKACKPKVTVKLDGKELKAGEDYDFSYSNNTNIGKALVTITGKNNYTGNIPSKTFDITVKKGSTYTVGAYKYKITSNSEVSFAGLKNKKTTKVSVPKTAKIGGKTFKVTAIDAKALSKTGITSVTIESNVKTIGNSAFEGCSKLTKVTIGTGVTKLGTSTFKSCKKLGSITIKSTKLKTVGKNALKGIKSNAKIKVPSKKLKDYKKLLKGKGQGKKVKITK